MRKEVGFVLFLLISHVDGMYSPHYKMLLV